MGNSCNKVSPVGCTTQISCTVPVWCGTPLCCAEPKVQPVSPKPAAPAPDASEAKNSTWVEPFEQPATVVVTEVVVPETPKEKPADDTSKHGAVEAAVVEDFDAKPADDLDPEDISAPKPVDPDAPDQSAVEPLAPESAAPEATEAPAVVEVVESAEPPAEPLSELPAEFDADAVAPPELAPVESAASLASYTFDADALVALEPFGLRNSAEVLVSRASGQAAFEVIQRLCQLALDAGAATHNCQRLLTQLRLITDILARAHSIGVQKRLIKTILADELQPILQRAEAVFGSWSHKGTLENFLHQRDADDQFLLIHLHLLGFIQEPSFVALLASLPEEAVPLTASGKVIEEPTGYNSVEASRSAFERLLLLFILRYKPSATRTQQQRLLDLLHTYNSSSCSPPEADIEHLVKARLDKAAKNVLPLLENIMTNMWEAASVPTMRVRKWRMAVQLALEPLRAATGELRLPLTPLSQEFEED